MADKASCLVQTTIGPVQGFVDPAFPGVKQWLGVPFAEPPVGELRFAPPQPKKPLAQGQVLAATQMPRAPMQSNTTKPNLYAKYVPEFLANGPYSEDCLYLNIFTPRQPATQEPLPTLVIFYPGELEWGGINTEYLQPQRWVQRSQRHNVVLFNCRLGVFGFPNAKGLTHGAIGILDQRRALEFIRDNIGVFGGSPSHIVAYGNASGAACIEAHLFAWPDDPIISGAILMSGFISMGTVTRDLAQESFPRLARRLNCPEDASPEKQLEFMRGLDAGAIQGCLASYKDSGIEPTMYFRPQADGVVVFSPEEQKDRANRGRFAKVPLLVGRAAEEGNALAPFGDLAAGTEAGKAASAKWTQRFEGALQQTVNYRLEHGCTIYQCLYAGDFANISPRPWMKSYHFSELPMIMGTHEAERGPSTDFQRQLSAKMQDMWVDFASNPKEGLAKWGWEAVTKDCSDAMVLGRDGILYESEGRVSRDQIHEKMVIRKGQGKRLSTLARLFKKSGTRS